MSNRRFVDPLESRLLYTAAPIVSDSGFETPALSNGAFAYGPSGSPWTFTPETSVNGAGVASNGSLFFNTNAPEGKQVAFLQDNNSIISQKVSGLTPGAKYTISFYEEGRRADGGFPYGANRFEVLLDNQIIVAPRVPTSTTSFDHVSVTFTAPTGSAHTLTFKGLGTTASFTDVTTFFDSVQLAPAPVSSVGVVTGSVFNDVNGDGKKDGTDAGVGGWLVYVDANNNGQFDPGETTAITGNSGDFSLSLKPGTYTIAVEVRRGFYQTSPHLLTYSLTVKAGATVSGDLFGVRPIMPA